MAQKLSFIERITGRTSDSPVTSAAAPTVVQPNRRSGVALGLGSGRTITPAELYVGYAKAAINVIANRFASEMLQNIRNYDSGGKQVDLSKHPIGEMLINPQMENTTYDIWEQLGINIEVFGHTHLHTLTNQAKSKHVGIEVMPSDQVIVFKWDEYNMIPLVYQYQPNADVRFEIEAANVITLKHYNPRDPRYGYSSISAAGDHHISEQAAAAHVKNHLYNSGFQNMLVALEETLEPDAFNSLKTDFAQMYSGAAASGKNVFFNGIKADVTQLSSKLSDLDISGIEQVAVDAILSSFGVSRAMIGLEGINLNRATAEVQERQLIQNVIIPLMRRAVAGLNMWTGQYPQYAKQGFTLGFVDPSVESVEEELAKAQTMSAKAQGVAVLVSAGETLANAKLIMEIGEEADAQVSESTKAGNTAKTNAAKNAKSRLSNTKWKQYQKANSDPRIEEATDVLISGLQTHYNKLKNKIIREFKKQNAFGVGDVFIMDEMAAVAAEIRPGLMDLYKLAGNETEAFMWELSEADTLLKTGFKPSQDLTERTSNFIDKAAKRVSETNSQIISDLISQGIASGKTQTEIAAEIDTAFNGQIETWRADRLARTEVVRINNLGEQDGVKQWADIVDARVFKVWRTNSPDPCQFCQALNGTRVEVSDLFVGHNGKIEGTEGGVLQNSYDDMETPPTHPNCACSVTMEVE